MAGWRNKVISLHWAILIRMSLAAADTMCSQELQACKGGLLDKLGGINPCLLPADCIGVAGVCTVVKEDCSPEVEATCRLISTMSMEDLLCGWKKEDGGTVEEDLGEIQSNTTLNEGQAAEEEEEDSKEEDPLGVKEMTNQEKSDLDSVEEETTFTEGWSFLEWGLSAATGILACLSFCCCCCCLKRWCTRKISLPGPFPMPKQKSNCFAHLWQSCKVTFQQKRLARHLVQVEALLACNPAHPAFVQQYYPEVMERIYSHVGFSTIFKGGSMELMQMGRSDITPSSQPGKGDLEVISVAEGGPTGIANPHYEVDADGNAETHVE